MAVVFFDTELAVLFAGANTVVVMLCAELAVVI